MDTTSDNCNSAALHTHSVFRLHSQWSEPHWDLVFAAKYLVQMAQAENKIKTNINSDEKWKTFCSFLLIKPLNMLVNLQKHTPPVICANFLTS